MSGAFQIRLPKNASKETHELRQTAWQAGRVSKPPKAPKEALFYFNKSLGLSSEYPEMTISESGLYALVLRSRKPEARKFAK